MGRISSLYEGERAICDLMPSWAVGPRRHGDEDRALDTAGGPDEARAVSAEAIGSRTEAARVFASASCTGHRSCRERRRNNVPIKPFGALVATLRAAEVDQAALERLYVEHLG
jgi:hypothetical protein